MRDPTDGKVKPYIEIWRDFEIPPGSNKAIILEKATKDNIGDESDDAGNVDNVVNAWLARMGNWQVALAQLDDGSYGAWQAVRDENDPKTWRILKQVKGEKMTSIPPVTEERNWKEGDLVLLEGLRWIVKECF